jgi:hypothetical protein
VKESFAEIPVWYTPGYCKGKALMNMPGYYHSSISIPNLVLR